MRLYCFACFGLFLLACTSEIQSDVLESLQAEDRIVSETRDPRMLCEQVIEHESCFGLSDWQNYQGARDLVDECSEALPARQSTSLIMNLFGGGGLQCVLVNFTPWAQSEKSFFECLPCPPGAPVEQTGYQRVGAVSDIVASETTLAPSLPVYFPPDHQDTWTPDTPVYLELRPASDGVSVTPLYKKPNSLQTTLTVIVAAVVIVVVGVAAAAFSTLSAALTGIGVLLLLLWHRFIQTDPATTAAALEQLLNQSL